MQQTARGSSEQRFKFRFGAAESGGFVSGPVAQRLLRAEVEKVVSAVAASFSCIALSNFDARVMLAS